MKCINKELVQKYIDGESSLREIEIVRAHIKTCERCACSIEKQKMFVDNLKKSMCVRHERSIEIPAFIQQPVQKKKFFIKTKYYMYAAAVACVLLLFFFLVPEKDNDDDIRLIYVLEGDFDANKTVKQQDMGFLMIDSDGKVMEFQ